MKKRDSFGHIAICAAALLPMFAFGNDAPPPPPTSSTTTTTTETNTTTTITVVTGLPTGTTTTTQTDGTVVSVTPPIATEANQSSVTIIATKPDKTVTLETNVTKDGATVATTKIDINTTSTAQVKPDGSLVATTTGALPAQITLMPTGRSSIRTTTTTGQQNTVDFPRSTQSTVSGTAVTGSVSVRPSTSVGAAPQVLVSTLMNQQGATMNVNTGTSVLSLSTYTVSTATGMRLIRVPTSAARALEDDGITDIVVEEVNSSTGEETYDAMMSRFTSERRFVVAERIERSLVASGKKIEIVPSAAAQFEEVVTFNGKRSIRLVSGSAQIAIDGNESSMTINKFYTIPTKKLEEVLASVSKHAAGKLTLKKGWNIVTPPTPCKIYASAFNNIASKSGSGKGLVYVYKQAGGGYETLGYTGPITPGLGVYIKVDSDQELDFSYIVPDSSFNFASFYATVGEYGGWKLMGAPVVLSAKNILDSGAQKFISMQGNGWSSWYDNTLLDSSSVTVDAGTGFWILK